MTAILISLTQGMVTQVVQVVKNPALNAGDPREADSISGLEDPLEKDMATHSSIPAWEIARTEEPGGLQSMGLQRVRHNWAGTCVRAKGIMSYAYFSIRCKGLSSLESNRTKFKSELWYLAVRFWTDYFISFVAARAHHSYCVGARSSKEVGSTKGLSLGRKTPTHRWFIAI